jgi:ADP-heptose:LPS heptosyltransferase
VQLLSLQRGVGKEQLASVAFPVVDAGAMLEARGSEFLDTAALLKNLDLVITADTAMGHLAGGLGVPCWIALAHFADWRWFQTRHDSPWYPSVRLFRQQIASDWAGVFAHMVAALAQLTPPTKP